MDAEENARLRDELIRVQQETIAAQTEQLRLQHNELAELRHRAYLVDYDPLGFALWVLLKGIAPFKQWYKWRYR